MRRTTIALSCIATACAVTAVTIESCEEALFEESARTTPRHHHRRSRARTIWSMPRFVYEAPFDGGGIYVEADESVYDAAVQEGPSYEQLEREMCAPLARALCDRRARCACDVATDCVEREEDKCASWLMCMYPQAEVPGLAIDPERLSRCLEAARVDHCAPLDLAECARLLLDPAIPGENCASGDGYECTGGVCYEGNCDAYSRTGEPCGNGCATGYCDDEGFCREAPCDEEYPGCPPGRVCRGTRCVRGRSIGGACDPEARGDDDCELGLVCDEDTSLCVRHDRCDDPDDCANIDMCVGASTFTCEPTGMWPLHVEGQGCAAEPDCQPGLLCVDGLCSAAPGLGEPCPRRMCRDRLMCSGPYDTAVCVVGVLAREGEPCSYALPCVRGTYCRLAGGDEVCVREPGIGEACEGRCANGLACIEEIHSGACRPIICEADVDPSWMCDVD